MMMMMMMIAAAATEVERHHGQDCVCLGSGREAQAVHDQRD